MSRSAVLADAPTPAEVLIPEARSRQRQRYRRSTALVALGMLLVGGLVALLFSVASSGSSTSQTTPKPSVGTGVRGPILVRPVLCLGPSYSASAPRGTSSLPLGCPAPYAQTASALNVQPQTNSPTGFSNNSVAPYPVLAGYPNTTRDSLNHVVLLGGLPGSDIQGVFGRGVRYLLGPSTLKLSSANVVSAAAQQEQTGGWIVKIRLSSAASASWDKTASQSFHSFLALDVGGKVATVPLIEPDQSSFTSFNGVMEWSGGFSASTARAIAAAAKG